MSDVWDTTLAARLYPGSEIERAVSDRAAGGDPVALSAPTVHEVVRGLSLRAAGADPDHRFANARVWFERLVHSDMVDVIPLDADAAVVAGRIRAREPHPGGRREGSKAEARVSWVLDIQIAACAWVAGRTLVTANQRDFTRIATLIIEQFPGADSLEVRTSS